MAKLRLSACSIGIAVAFAALALDASAGPALAEPGTVTWTTYAYALPDDHSAVIDEVLQGRSVEIDRCTGAWCRIVLAHRDGFIRSELLARAGAAGGSVLPQPGDQPDTARASPCFEARKTGGNGGDTLLSICQRRTR